MKKRIFSRLMAMVIALALLSSTAFAWVEIDQNYIDRLNTTAQDNWDGAQFVSVPQGEGSDNEYRLVQNVKTDYTLLFSNNATLDLNGFTIDHQEKAGSVLQVGDSTNSGAPYTITLIIKDTSEDGTGTITGGNERCYGGGIELNGAIVVLEGGNITGNRAFGGGGIGAGGKGRLIMSGGSITNNEARNGGAVSLTSGGNAEITGGVITGNIATGAIFPWEDTLCDGVYAHTGSIGGDAAVCGNGVDGKGTNVYWSSKENAQ